jgi:hypothetical protein
MSSEYSFLNHNGAVDDRKRAINEYAADTRRTEKKKAEKKAEKAASTRETRRLSRTWIAFIRETALALCSVFRLWGLFLWSCGPLNSLYYHERSQYNEFNLSLRSL